MKRNILLLFAFLIGFICAFIFQQIRMNKITEANKVDIQRAQHLFDLDQKTISIDVNAYQTLLHCYDKPTTCDIFIPGNKADQFEVGSMNITKEKQAFITKYPYLIPEQYKAAWGIK